MKCQMLVSGDNITNLSSDELAKRVEKVKHYFGMKPIIVFNRAYLFRIQLRPLRTLLSSNVNPFKYFMSAYY